MVFYRCTVVKLVKSLLTMARRIVGLEPKPEHIAIKLVSDYTFDDIQLGYILNGT
jgi:hypothetical protein